ncbi:hypothetical protein LJR074_002158 [Acidovorax sp. LjRoot74]|uniref:hypothetical protein n=1 Tax=Acidovorax sp. LjRoot74 TaxID=3342337 RepID=UPI003ECE47C2
MATFLWFLIGLLAFENLGRIFWLAKGEYPARHPGQIAVDLVFGLCLIGGIGYLLATAG